MWTEWVDLLGVTARLHDDDSLDLALDGALAELAESPRACVAVLAPRAAMAAWRTGRDDRRAALVDEGLLEIADDPPPPPLDARSAAEAILFEALEGDASTRGKFELNGLLSIRFGSAAAEVDLVARRERIAIEIDGHYHFTDLEAWRRDRRKDLALQLHGFVVLRVLATDVMRAPAAALHEVKRVLAMRLEGAP